MNTRISSVIVAAIILAAARCETWGATLIVTNTNDAGAGSLRQAILDSNASAGVLDTITFNIAGSGVHRITPGAAAGASTGLGPLPSMGDPVIVDGYTQPGASANTLIDGNNAVLLIELNGSSAGPGTGGVEANGLIASAGSSTIRGLVINSFATEGIRLVTNNGSTVAGNFIGTDPTGTLARPNGAAGVSLTRSSNHQVGGTAPAARNLISGNTGSAISIFLSSNNVIEGNFINTNAAGTAALGTGASAAINVTPASDNNRIGGASTGARNLISGSRNEAITIQGTYGTVVEGNYIGTDITGDKVIGTNLGRGASCAICLLGGRNPFGSGGDPASGNRIGGTTPGAGNVIAGYLGPPNTEHGAIFLGGQNGDTNTTVIQGNFIGTNKDGTLPLGNEGDGVRIGNGNDNLLGGSVPGAANIIANCKRFGNQSSFGITVRQGLRNRILNNSIYHNENIGIDLAAFPSGPTLNDPVDADTGPNNLQNFPVLSSVTNDGVNTTIAGTLNSIANTIFLLQFFSNNVRDISGFGQGENFIGAMQVTTDGAGDATFNAVFPQGNDGQWFAATATDPNGNTSEFSAAHAAAGPVILNTTVVTARNGQPFRFRVLTTGGNSTQRLRVDGLPPGLSANAVSGVISGRPTVDGGYSVLVTVTDGAIITESDLLIAVVSDPGLPVIVSPSVVNVPKGQPFTYKIDAPITSLPSDPTKYGLLGTLPPGLQFNAETGTISGTLTVVQGMRQDGPESTTLTGGALLGVLQMFASNSRGRATSPIALLQQPPMAVNIATRLPVGTSENVLIGGFIVIGNAPKIVVIRGIGPSLNASGLQGALQDPVLELRSATGALLAHNDDWRTDQEADILETTIPPVDQRESAIVAVLDPASYTAIVRGQNNSTGIGLVEIYDLGTASLDVESGAQLANISTRGFVNTDNNVMIGGIISANGAAKFMVRALGPSLSGAGIQGVLADPTLELRSANGNLVSSNDNWKTRPDGSSQQGEIEETTIPPTDARESAIVQILSPGAYTAIIRGQSNSTGVALVEVYNLQ